MINPNYPLQIVPNFDQISILVFFIILFQTHLALYCFANSQIIIALKLLYRARYLMLLTCGENHPEVALLDVRAL